ncbi:MAG: hypothetical protein EOS50_14105 [Mesorhizobium sp.]|nr:MAG: hypothetical protein EOS34_07295 [Mesorhizobium sp.]RWD82613.1 MAG: hypothetical protein EOS48_12645 [Mesorhizobium sp.]RWE99656.1 MAG: hypothetical protein EOS43_14870 [Mesorhizobium sp.]RWF55347.1 MAG: hypothetical protein EOS50_14105 [Mesorhizobium sp.]TIS42045.1 MAG: hypothetical protein E5W95_01950 [Mesorhizobium sp.]
MRWRCGPCCHNSKGGNVADPLIRFAATFSPRGEEVASVGVSPFSPTGRSRAEGPDEEAGSKGAERGGGRAMQRGEQP